MKRSIFFPGKYVQGRGVLSEAGSYAGLLGKKPVVIWGPRTKAAVGQTLADSFAAQGLAFEQIAFCGECTKDESARIAAITREKGCDVIVGVGGGKVIDAAKGAAAQESLPILVIPTVASNDAPTSACTVWYNDEGECVGFDLWKLSPDIILVDTEVIAHAPVRMFIAGMGDALATWPEARAAYQSRAVSCAGGVPTMTAMTLAKLCFDTLMEYGPQAKAAVEQQIVTPALEKVVEATTLLSGVGWESGGLCCAHAVANSLPSLHETHGFLHGEKVALGLMIQLCLEEDLCTEEIHRIVDFMIGMGMPVTLDDLNLGDVSRERLADYAAMVAAEGSFVHNHNFNVTPADVLSAIIAADDLGKRRKALRAQ